MVGIILKRKPDGSILEFRTRFVVKGPKWTYRPNYYDTFFTHCNLNAVRTVLAIAAAQQMYMKQFDFSYAAICSKLDHPVYVHPPRGVKLADHMVLKLKKSLFGYDVSKENH